MRKMTDYRQGAKQRVIEILHDVNLSELVDLVDDEEYFVCFDIIEKVGNVTASLYLPEMRLKKSRFFNFKNCDVCNYGKYGSTIRFTFGKDELEHNVTISEDVSENIITKILKLLALSESPNENEAARAALKAQELLAKYHLTLDDIEGEEVEPIFECRYYTESGNKWKWKLGAVVARNYSCRMNISRRVGGIYFYGYEKDILTARIVFDYLFKTGNKLARKAVSDYKARFKTRTAKGVRNTFLRGFVDGIDAKLGEQCQALALQVPASVDTYYETRFAAIKFASGNFELEVVSHSVYTDGKSAGRSAVNARILASGQD